MDAIDRKLLALLQVDADTSLQQLAEHVNLSRNPCWRRIQRLREQGVIRRNVALLEPAKLHLTVTAFVNVKTRTHSEAWFAQFHSVVSAIPEVVEFYRMSGEVDYLLKVVVPSIEDFDRVYKHLIRQVELAEVSTHFAMEVLKNTSELPLHYL